MLLLRAQNLTKSYNNQLVLDGVSFEIHSGDKIGLIGVNGSGKSTLLKILMGIEKDYLGQIWINNEILINYLPQVLEEVEQDATAGEVFLREFLKLQKTKEKLEELENKLGQSADVKLFNQYSSTLEKFEALGGYQFLNDAEVLFSRLGFSREQWNLKFKKLSGGEKTRLMLGRILLKNPHLLLLDEPTNHTDVETMDWLSTILNNFRGAFLVISHDRYFLDRTVNKIIELEDSKIKVFKGNYTDYKREKDRIYLEKQRQYEKTEKEKERLKKVMERQMNWFDKAHKDAGTNDFLRRKAKKMAKRAKAFEKRINSLEKNQSIAPKKRDRFNLNFGETKRSGKDLITFIEVSFNYPGSKNLFTNLSFNVERGDIVGIIGPNGIGKTTLLKLMLGKLTPTSGEIIVNQNLQIGYFSQELDQIDLNLTPMEVLIREGLKPDEARTLLGNLQLRGDEVFESMDKLSMGERARVVLARLMVVEPDILILDEPTNHLDIPSREKLEESLKQYSGTIILISHDRYLIKGLAEKLLVFKDNRVEFYHGCLNEYEESEYYQKVDEDLLLKLELARITGLLADERLIEEERSILEDQCQKLQNRLKDL